MKGIHQFGSKPKTSPEAGTACLDELALDFGIATRFGRGGYELTWQLKTGHAEASWEPWP